MLKMHDAVTVTFTAQFEKYTTTFTSKWQEVYPYMRKGKEPNVVFTLRQTLSTDQYHFNFIYAILFSHVQSMLI